MGSLLLRCISCKTYTLSSKCHVCSSKAVNPKPPKFSIEDKYGHYRRLAKQVE